MFKYIIFEDAGCLTKLIIFDCITDHSTIRNRFETMGWTVISAGKVNFGKKEWDCHNGSVTLCLSYHREQSIKDLETIKKLSEIY